MNEPNNTKKKTVKKVAIVTLVAAAAAYGTVAYLNREPDPTKWNAERSGYESTK